ncbi:MAG: hypothetical protein HY893_08640 [Deltaproteobacteria bacterium]|nr:hypothetical protein [Deltaproteobacteria bacterium]
MQYYQDSFVIFGAFALFIVMAIGVILVLWIAMPFSIFGTKRLLKKLIEEQERTNALLRSMAEQGRRQEAFKEKAAAAEEEGGGDAR